MDFFKLLFTGGILIFLSVPIAAQINIISQNDSIPSYRLHEVVVSATKSKLLEYETASSVTVIDSSRINDLNKNNVLGLLKGVHGLSITTQGSPGSLSYVYMRGANPGQTLVLIDGIEMNMPNDPANTFDFADLPVDDIQRIEILRGPQSTLYGSDALAGVIDIITKKGYGKPKYFFSTEAGSYSTFKGTAGLSGSFNSANYSLTISRFQSKGFSSASSRYGNTEKDGTQNLNLVSRLGYNFSANFNLNFFARYTNAKTDFDQHGGLFGDDSTYIYNLEEQAYRAESELNLFDGMWKQKAGVSFLRNVRKYSFDSTLYNNAMSRSIYEGNKLKFDWQNDIELNSQNILTLGLETEKEMTNSDYYYSSIYGVTSSVFPDKSAVTTGIFLQHQLKFENSFFNTAGVRYDKHSRFGPVVTFRIAPAYIFWKTGTKIRATYGTGFKAPSLFYLFDPAYGNQDLKPEKSRGWDAGIEQYLFHYQITAGFTYFNNKFTNLFGFDAGTFKTININSAETKGFEVYLTGNLTSALNLNLNYTFTDAKDTSPDTTDGGKPLLRRPKNKVALDFNYNLDNKAGFNIEAVFVGQRDDKKFTTYPSYSVARVKLADYTVINLACSYQMTKKIRLYGRIENLFNKYYEDIFGYATPGLSGYLGVKLNIGK